MSVHEHEHITIIVDGCEVVVHSERSTVRAILDAAGIDPHGHVLVEIRGDERIDFDDPDEEVRVHDGTRFETKPRVYHIFVNGRERDVHQRVLTFDDIVKIDPNPPPPPPPGEETVYTITFFDAVKPVEGTLIKGESVVIKNGTRINVRGTNRS